MRQLGIIIFGLLTIGCGSQSHTGTPDREYYKSEAEMFGYSAELQLSSDNNFKITSIDFHSRTGGIYEGIYTWNGQLLTLNYQDSRQKQFFLDSAKLFEIEELDTLIAESDHYKQEYNIYELSIKPELTNYSQPARTNWEQWNQGRIENFDQLLKRFKNDPMNTFETN